jgi:hypothetical protein
MRLIEWEVPEDGYEEQIVIPKEKRDLAAEEGINTENKQKGTIKDNQANIRRILHWSLANHWKPTNLFACGDSENAIWVG